MSFRVSRRINNQFVRNINRSVPSKKEAESQPPEDVTSKSPPRIPSLVGVSSVTTKGYQVCQPRKIVFAPYRRDIHNETDAARKAIALQHLQPSLLPVYYSKRIDLNASAIESGVNTEREIKTKTKTKRYFYKIKQERQAINSANSNKTALVTTRTYSTISNQRKSIATPIRKSRVKRSPVIDAYRKLELRFREGEKTQAPIRDAHHHLHPCSVFFIKGKDECKKPADKKKEPCGWVKQDKAQAKKKSSNPKDKKQGPKSEKKAVDKFPEGKSRKKATSSHDIKIVIGGLTKLIRTRSMSDGSGGSFVSRPIRN